MKTTAFLLLFTLMSFYCANVVFSSDDIICKRFLSAINEARAEARACGKDAFRKT
ncbi:MAG: hypothetical protein H7844_10670 [Nitrospirae bacterium YQR-1]